MEGEYRKRTNKDRKGRKDNDKERIMTDVE